MTVLSVGVRMFVTARQQCRVFRPEVLLYFATIRT
ncbi:hypothetical protein DSM3645_02593 [Blastopirellula marina DSM 3645]|uniref:Uncharacterized protein n=1 Tax=Blastopirellula marina DSM 3645 TaxID=314230 RepID=A3ZVI2_9BACT|nr:hypothetical protein DSM3645_02593 [Blastopirellula marina DSM 3645]